MQTCRKIVHWRTSLKFPPEPRLPAAALDLMRRLLCDVEDRLGSHGGAAEIKVRAAPVPLKLEQKNIVGKQVDGSGLSAQIPA